MQEALKREAHAVAKVEALEKQGRVLAEQFGKDKSDGERAQERLLKQLDALRIDVQVAQYKRVTHTRP